MRPTGNRRLTQIDRAGVCSSMPIALGACEGKETDSGIERECPCRQDNVILLKSRIPVPEDPATDGAGRKLSKRLNDSSVVLVELLHREIDESLVGSDHDIVILGKRMASLMVVQPPNDAFDHAEQPREIDTVGQPHTDEEPGR